MPNTYPVGIELDKALKDPKSDANIILRAGDRLLIPSYTATVKINGAVMYPNTVSYERGESVRHYLDAAGGFAQNARKSGVYIIYMNGMVGKVSRGAKVEPGRAIEAHPQDEHGRDDEPRLEHVEYSSHDRHHRQHVEIKVAIRHTGHVPSQVDDSATSFSEVLCGLFSFAPLSSGSHPHHNDEGRRRSALYLLYSEIFEYILDAIVDDPII